MKHHGLDRFSYLLEHEHIRWIVQTPFGWQRSVDSPQLHLSTEGKWWGETDRGLRVTTRLARSLGIKTHPVVAPAASDDAIVATLVSWCREKKGT